MGTTATEMNKTAFGEMMDAISRERDFLSGGEPVGVVAKEWIDAGFTAASASPWWQSKCFDAVRTAQLRDAGVAPEDLGVRLERGRETLGYEHSNGDVSLAEVLALVGPVGEDSLVKLYEDNAGGLAVVYAGQVYRGLEYLEDGTFTDFCEILAGSKPGDPERFASEGQLEEEYESLVATWTPKLGLEIVGNLGVAGRQFLGSAGQ